MGSALRYWRWRGGSHRSGTMARGQQKIQSQQKNAKKQAEKKKHGSDQKAAAKAALVFTCPVCRTQMPDPKTFKQHFESKHPKSPMPPELVDVQA
ncbi:zinc finger protein 706-like isoform X1 [Dendrobates tinctorius]